MSPRLGWLCALPVIVLVACGGEEFTASDAPPGSAGQGAGGSASGASGQGQGGVAGLTQGGSGGASANGGEGGEAAGGEAGAAGAGASGAAGESGAGGAGAGGAAGAGAGGAGAAGAGAAGAGAAGAGAGGEGGAGAGGAGAGGEGGAGAGGAQPVCKVDLECSNGNPCVVATCQQGQCLFSQPFARLQLPDDVTGDCQQLVCIDSKLTYEASPDDTDPEGGCTPGTPKACATADECPSKGPCTVAICKDKACTHVSLPADTPIADDLQGDCRTPFCDAEGEVAYKDDPNDKVEGQCTLPPGGSCKVPNDCPVPKPCVALQCLNGHCIYTAKPEHTTLDDDLKGDCSRPLCDGNGGLFTVFDENDVKEDDNECTKARCDGDGLLQEPTPGVTCAGGMCNEEGLCL